MIGVTETPMKKSRCHLRGNGFRAEADLLNYFTEAKAALKVALGRITVSSFFTSGM